jgi:hypothetical protein
VAQGQPCILKLLRCHLQLCWINLKDIEQRLGSRYGQLLSHWQGGLASSGTNNHESMLMV